MAKSSRKKPDAKQKVEEAEVSPALSEDVPEDTTSDVVKAEASDAASDSVEEPAENAVQADPQESSAPDIQTEEPTVAPLPEQEAAPAPAQTTQPKSSGGGFVIMLLGGVAAGAIGYGIATFYPAGGQPQIDVEALIAEQSARIEMLESQQAAGPDLSEIDARIDVISASLSSQIESVTSTVDSEIEALNARLQGVERQPLADGTLSDRGMATYEQELDALRAEMEAQKQEVLSLAEQAQADLGEAREQAAALEDQALASAQAAAARAAINRIIVAAETGAPFADVLADPSLADAVIPSALSDAAESGVPTTAQLAADFPEVARLALATARAEGVSDDSSGLGGFLRMQFDVRSTTPQDGPGPDAVLSRAEAAIKGGRVADALAELEALPEVARADMTDWTAGAQARSDVLAAIAVLAETLNAN